MIILLQNVETQSRRFFWHVSYYKVRQRNIIITNCNRLLLRSAKVLESVIDCYYKVCHVLQK